MNLLHANDLHGFYEKDKKKYMFDTYISDTETQNGA